MKIDINAELIGDEVITEYFLPGLVRQGLSATKDNIKTMVQNKAGDFIEVDPVKIKFIWKN